MIRGSQPHDPPCRRPGKVIYAVQKRQNQNDNPEDDHQRRDLVRGEPAVIGPGHKNGEDEAEKASKHRRVGKDPGELLF